MHHVPALISPAALPESATLGSPGSPFDALVIETAASACSVALLADGKVVAHRHDEIARGHAERLLPMIAELPGKGRAASILVDCGPGSFTGLRVGLAAARALGFVWHVPVRGFRTLDLLATAAGHQRPERDRMLMVTLGGHGEWFVQPFARQADGMMGALAPFRSLRPEAALETHGDDWFAVGSAAPAYAALASGMDFLDLTPDAREVAGLPASMLMEKADAVYGRGADAKPMAPAT